MSTVKLESNSPFLSKVCWRRSLSISQVQNVVWLPAGLPALFFVLGKEVSDEGACLFSPFSWFTSFPPDTLRASEEEEKKGKEEEEKEEDDILVLRSGDVPTELEESICEKFIKFEGGLAYSI